MDKLAALERAASHLREAQDYLQDDYPKLAREVEQLADRALWMALDLRSIRGDE